MPEVHSGHTTLPIDTVADGAAFDAAWREGRALTLYAAVRLALDDGARRS